MDQLWRVLTLSYAAFYALFGFALHRDNTSIGYPAAYVAYSALMQVALVVGIIAFALGLSDKVASIWRWLFVLIIADLIVGVSLDAMVPDDFNLSTHGMAWIGNLLFNLWLAAPAYYCSFKLAGYKWPERT